MKRLMLTLIAIALAAASARACNIPVFRYALERWRPDNIEFIVFHSGPLSDEDRGLVDELRKTSAAMSANVEVILVDIANPSSTSHSHLGSLLRGKALTLPFVQVRLSHARGPITAWRGPLSAALESALVESPVRQALSKRLLSGDSIVWLMVRSRDEDRNAKTRALVLEQCEQLHSKIRLPEGIGLPGSELYSEVPLFLKFSLLEIDPNDDREQFLIRLFQGLQPDAFRDGEPLLIPVFGRGRALEVIPADGVDSRLMEDLTAFLCGACSCQVKEQNPGFDLLLSTDWDRQLFGEDSEIPPPAKSVGQGDQTPVLLTIPPGRRP